LSPFPISFTASIFLKLRKFMMQNICSITKNHS
jgi:hypothetical protein